MSKCSIKQAAALAVKASDAYARAVAHDVLREALQEDGRKVPARLKTSERSAAAAFKAVDRKRRACDRPVLVRHNSVELAHKHARKLAKRLKIKISI